MHIPDLSVIVYFVIPISNCEDIQTYTHVEVLKSKRRIEKHFRLKMEKREDKFVV